MNETPNIYDQIDQIENDIEDAPYESAEHACELARDLARLADDLRRQLADQGEPQLTTLVKEIHQAVTTPPIVISGIDPAEIDMEELTKQIRSSHLMATEPGVNVVQPNQITLEVGVTKRELNDLDVELGAEVANIRSEIDAGADSADDLGLYEVRDHYDIVLSSLRGRLDDVYDLVADRLAKLSRKASDDSPERNDNYYRDINGNVVRAEEGLVDDEHPETNYGVRVFYDDGTAEDIPNIAGVQVVDTRDTTFPFGFIADGDDDEARAGFWRAEDGEFEEFDARQRPKPNGGW